jgi:nucleotide-binding universal stress UspA family protein
MTQPYRQSHAGPLTKLHHILIATDFSAASDAAVEMGASVARDASASVQLLCVLEALMYVPAEMASLAESDPDLHPEATRRMASTLRRIHELEVENVSSGIEFGIAADVLVRYANSARFDLLILGRAGRGSTSAFVIPRVSIPVMVVPFVRT